MKTHLLACSNHVRVAPASSALRTELAVSPQYGNTLALCRNIAHLCLSTTEVVRERLDAVRGCSEREETERLRSDLVRICRVNM